MKKRILTHLTIIILLAFFKDVSAGTFKVINNLPTGAGSLEKAIQNANLSAGMDTILFEIQSAPYKITVGNALPIISSPVFINGYSQTGSAANAPLIEIDGNNRQNAVLELSSAASNSTITGLVIYGSPRGIYLNGSNSNTIKGCFIGTDVTGTVIAPNKIQWNGIQMDNSSNNIIGGPNPIDRNIVSGVGERAIFAHSGICANNIIINNYLGTDITGTIAIQNGYNGVCSFPTVNFNNSKIGGSTPDSLNLISGNKGPGINLQGTAVGVVISGNIIGSDITKTISVPNNTGIQIWDGSDVTIKNNYTSRNLGYGIYTDRTPNLIVIGNTCGGNAMTGMRIDNAPNTKITGNKVGVEEDGITLLGNNGTGIDIESSANIIVGGANASDRNIIAGNKNLGIYSNNSSNSIFKGNYIGIAADGTTAIGNGAAGMQVVKSKNAIIGGITPGERNIVSNNGAAGIMVSQGSDSSLVEGNYVGLDASGIVAMGNKANGIFVSGAVYVTVGSGKSYGSRNIVAANKDNGISFSDGANNGIIKGNFVGINKNGAWDTILGNKNSGINFGSNIDGAFVGGTTLVERNISSGNGFGGEGDGLRSVGLLSKPHNKHITVKGNYFGTDTSGTKKIGNFWAGLSLNETDSCYVGGVTPEEGNLISGNLNEGVYFRNAENITLIGNFIGTAANHVNELANDDYGINIVAVSLDNVIKNNIIAYTRKTISDPTRGPSGGNGGSGIIVDSNAQRQHFSENKIFCNLLTGIFLANASNEGIKPPVITYTDGTLTKGTAKPLHTVEIFRNPSSLSCGCQGEIYVATVVADVNGDWSYTHNLGNIAKSMTATQTTPAGSTSAFSSCCTAPEITANPTTATVCPGATTNFSVGTSGNAQSFQWQRKIPGGIFENIANTGVHSLTTTASVKVSTIPVSMDKYQYRVVVSGCYMSVKSDSAVLNVSHPVMSITGDSLICSGGSTTLTASGAIAGSYVWTNPIALNTSTGNVVTATPASTFTYRVKGKDANSCVDSAQKIITVINQPILTISGDSSICKGTKASFSAGGASKYTWSPSTDLNTTDGKDIISSTQSDITYTVTGTIGTTCSATKTVKVTVLDLPKLIVSGNNPICSGSSDTLKASGANSYSWTPAATLDKNNVADVIAKPNADITYTVIGTHLNGCIDSLKVPVTVKPTPNIVVNTALPAVCKGGQTTISASGATDYTWTPTTDLNFATGQSVISSPTATRKYIVTGKNNGCQDTASIVITFKPLPTVTITKDTLNICKGGSVTIDGTSNATSFAWNPSSDLSLASILTPKAAPGSETKYVVTATLNGCDNKDSVIVKVNELPVINASDKKICKGEVATLSATGAVLYNWSPATDLDGTTGNTVKSSTQTTRNYTVTGTDANNCQGSKTIQVLVFDPPAIAASDKTICKGDSAILTASGLISYNWSPAANLNTTSGNTVIAKVLSTTPYTVSGTDANGCPGSKTIQVLITNPPIISVASDSVCQGQSVSLTATGADSYAWNSSSTLDRTDSSVVVSRPSSDITYSVVGKIGQCAGSTNVTVIVKHVPVVTALTDTTITTGNSTNIKLNATGVNNPGFAWTYTLNENAVSGAMNGTGNNIHQSLVNSLENPGIVTYTVIATKDNCDSKPVKVNVKVLGGFKIPDIFSPNGDDKNEFFTFSGTNDFDITIYNRWGNIVYEGNEGTDRWNGTDASGEKCSEGTYYYILNAIDLKDKKINGTISLVR